MTENTEQQAIAKTLIGQTKDWLEQVVIGLNFCPFAKKEFVNNTIHYCVSWHKKMDAALTDVATELQRLEKNADIETTLVIFNQGFNSFERFLDLVDYANQLLVDLGYEGEFQIANFHPDYLFEGEPADSASHYTNRSPYPTLHLIREQSMARAVAHYPDPESIPDNNIALAEQKGISYFENILANIKH